MPNEQETNRIRGGGVSATIVANNILKRAFEEQAPVTPMKLQRLLFFTACLYQRSTRRRLLSEPFQPWKYGPVCLGVYDKFRPFGPNPISRYARDATGNVQTVDEAADPALRRTLTLVWTHMGGMSAVALSRISCWPGSAWAQAMDAGSRFISEDAMAGDRTFDCVFGWCQD